MFVGREQELEALKELYRYDRFTCAAVFGRRRVGTTGLINCFLEGKRAVFFAPVEGSEHQNLVSFSRSITSTIQKTDPDTVFSSVSAALEYLFRGSETEKLVLVIDDFLRAEKVFCRLAEELRRIIDQYRGRSRLMLLLCGAPVGGMERRLKDPDSPLSEVIHTFIRLEPLGFEEACRYFKRFQPSDKVLAYGVFGGTPRYLRYVEDGQSLRENVQRCFLDSGAPLWEEPIQLLRKDIREPAAYVAILSAIASGAVNMSAIANQVGEGTNACATYLKTLIDMGLVTRETPYGESVSRKAIYSISDNMFRFWFRFMPENASLITRGAADQVWQRIEPELDGYMAEVFRGICCQYLKNLLLAGRSPVMFDSLGRWWGVDPLHKRKAEIDIMGAQSDGTAALFASCVWSESKVDEDVLDSLVEKSRLFPYRKTFLFLFSRVGFTRSCAERSRQMGDVRLVSFE